MKYFVLLCAGMADRKGAALTEKTPMETAEKNTMNTLSYRSFNGWTTFIQKDVNVSAYSASSAILGVQPTDADNRAALCAIAAGAAIEEDDTVYSCRLVSLSEDTDNYAEKTMIDASPEMTPEETSRLISALNKGLSTKIKKFRAGENGVHSLIWKRSPGYNNASDPMDAQGERIGDCLPSNESAARLLPVIEKSFTVLKDHPINVKRRQQGLLPINSIWLYGTGSKPVSADFKEAYKISGSVVSSDPAVRGVGSCVGLKAVNPAQSGKNAYSAIVSAVTEEFEGGADLVFTAVDDPCRAAYFGDKKGKIAAIEEADQHLLAPVYEYLSSREEPFKVMVTSGFGTSVEDRCAIYEPTPFFIYNSERSEIGYKPFSEANSAKSGFYLPDGAKLLSFMIRHPAPEKEETETENGQQQ